MAMATLNPSVMNARRLPLGARPLAWVRCLWDRMGASRSLGLAAEMAFWLFLSLLPLSAVAGLVTAKLAWAHGSTAAPVIDSLPWATRELLRTELAKVAAWKGGQVGLVSGVMFFWLASSGIHSVFDGIEVAGATPPRSWWKKRALALGTCVALSIGLALVAVLGYGLDWAWKVVSNASVLHVLTRVSQALGHAGRYAVSAGIVFVLVAGLYRTALPRGVHRSMPIVPGAILATLLHISLGYGYGYYIKKVGDGGAYQAGLTSIAITLMALYLFCLALLIGIEINELIGDRRRLLRQMRADEIFRGKLYNRSRARLSSHSAA
ncbi:Inner membrane protein YihY, formerly thought to be RNase BN [Minicystis rosea]|nr:Inner membrane protein YihY, formerly thought to be RNase BN [Minicystis rosea]